MSTQSITKEPLTKYGINAMARFTALALFTCAPLFLAAQTLSWDWAWIFTAVTLIGWISLNIYVARVNPGLLNERGKRSRAMVAGAKSWDMIILFLYMVMIFVVPTVAGFDYANGWSGETSPVIHAAGIVLMAIGFIPLAWGMASNRYFKGAVSIDPAGGQRVADGGAYRIVRHPGYLGLILQFLAMPVALGTWVALIPAVFTAVLFIVRTALEDRALQAELPGYREFAQRTRYRLLPGVW